MLPDTGTGAEGASAGTAVGTGVATGLSIHANGGLASIHCLDSSQCCGLSRHVTSGVGVGVATTATTSALMAGGSGTVVGPLRRAAVVCGAGVWSWVVLVSSGWLQPMTMMSSAVA